MFDLLSLIDLRLLLVLSPISTAIAWAMLIYQEPDLQGLSKFEDHWWF
ncbi:MAG: photosystem II protein Y [Pseudanabaenales cyanobacterium]|nr:photosystem II protein Y [Pseudanabaenales cyanobacterium]